MLVSCDHGGHDGVVVVALVSRWLWSSWSSRRSITVCVYKNILVVFLGGLAFPAGGEGGGEWVGCRRVRGLRGLGELWEGEGGGLEVYFFCMINIPFPLNPFPWPLYIPFAPFILSILSFLATHQSPCRLGLVSVLPLGTVRCLLLMNL